MCTRVAWGDPCGPTTSGGYWDHGCLQPWKKHVKPRADDVFQIGTCILQDEHWIPLHAKVSTKTNGMTCKATRPRTFIRAIVSDIGSRGCGFIACSDSFASSLKCQIITLHVLSVLLPTQPTSLFISAAHIHANNLIWTPLASPEGYWAPSLRQGGCHEGKKTAGFRRPAWSKFAERCLARDDGVSLFSLSRSPFVASLCFLSNPFFLFFATKTSVSPVWPGRHPSRTKNKFELVVAGAQAPEDGFLF